MVRPRAILLTIGLALVAPIVFSLSAAEPGGKATTAQILSVADTATTVTPEDAKQLESDLHRLDLRFAELSLRLTELDLQKIEDMNRRVAGIYSDSEVDRFRTAVAVARERVKAARQQAEGKDICAAVGMSEAAVKTAEDAYNRALSANRRLPTAVSAIEVERLKLAVDMAKVNVDRAKVVDKLDSPIPIVQWELDALREEVRQLRTRVSSITSRR